MFQNWSNSKGNKVFMIYNYPHKVSIGVKSAKAGINPSNLDKLLGESWRFSWAFCSLSTVSKSPTGNNLTRWSEPCPGTNWCCIYVISIITSSGFLFSLILPSGNCKERGKRCLIYEIVPVNVFLVFRPGVYLSRRELPSHSDQRKNSKAGSKYQPDWMKIIILSSTSTVMVKIENSHWWHHHRLKKYVFLTFSWKCKLHLYTNLSPPCAQLT